MPPDPSLTAGLPTGIELAYETFGEDDGVPLLLVMGLGAQMIAWDDALCQGLADRGFRVIRFDNRDVGLSSKVDVGDINVLEGIMAALGGQPVTAPYHLSDMADDAAGLLDHLNIQAAHVVGASMGGMIAQTLAVNHPERVLSLTSIMSTTGDRDVGQADEAVAAAILRPAARTRQEAVAAAVAIGRTIGSPEHFDEQRATSLAERGFDRCFYPQGVGHQLLAISASGSRTEGLRGLHVPTLVIHGEQDPLVNVSGGRRTAEVVPGAELMVLPEMAHDIPLIYWPQIIEAITALAARASASKAG